nr:hypothetical protein [Tanacetum cinerariifolium]
MDRNLSLGKICLGENVVEISSDKVEGSGEWDSPKYQDTSNSGGKKETIAMVFHEMDTEEISDRFLAPCFVNGLEAYDGEINLGVKENMISNEYAVILCLEHEVIRGNKVVKKELIVALRGKIYFLKFIINPEEDDVEPEVIFKISFLHMTKAITNFEAGTIIIYPDIDLFLEDIKEEEKRKSNRNKKGAMENLKMFYQDIGTSSLTGRHLTQEEADKVELDGIIMKEEEEAIKKVKGEVLKEKDDPRAFIFPIRLEGQVGVTTLIAKFLILDIPVDRDAPIVVGHGFLYNVLRTAKSDNDDEEEYEIKRNKFRASIYGPKPAPYLNCNDLTERSLALQIITNPFWKINVWKKAVSFLDSLPVPLKQVNWKPDYKVCYTKEEEATG